MTGAPAAFAASGPGIDGSTLGVAWALPFLGLLLSIAVMPVLMPQFWSRHFGKVSLAWSLAFLAPSLWLLGPSASVGELLHTMIGEYLPFMILLFALFVVAGGILVTGNFPGSPGSNTLLLGVGTGLASVLGTTGASMLLIRTVIRANEKRRHNVHIFVFFIFLVSNVGGGLTPLGDPPLFLGFLKGVDFTWTISAMFGPVALLSAILLTLFYVFDRLAWRREGRRHLPHTPDVLRLRIEGWQNFVYLAAALAAIVASGAWVSGVTISFGWGVERRLEGLMRDVALLAIGYLSWKTTKPKVRIENAFHWHPLQEVAILFAGIFVTMIPALAILAAGEKGALAPLLALVTGPTGQPVNLAYFWLTGVLSSFLDNAPTYLVFFNLAGGDPQQLMGSLAGTLLAISAGAVFMGANTYIGNAPNFMVLSICQEHGIRMPSFGGYMLWSGAILLPLFVLLSLIFFV